MAEELPSPEQEIWRYSRIDDLDLAHYPPASTAAQQSEVSAPPGVLAGGADVPGAEALVGRLTAAVAPWDAFVELNSAQCAAPVLVRVPAGAVVTEPIVIIHRADAGGALFPRTCVELEARSQATVVEWVLSKDVDAYVDSVVELVVGQDAELDHVVVQQLGRRVWQTAYHTSVVERGGVLRSMAVALGGDYARVRTDSRLVGVGGMSELVALYFGTGAQMHDFRTLQDHEGPKTTSDLVFKGAVAGEARSVYSGLIRVRHGAAGTKAFQTNRNLVLSETAHADSVPNLEIEENDVVCSHASATGPIDPEQRFYLESRGIPTSVAERLIVLGFFDDVLARLPVAELRPRLMGDMTAKLTGTSGDG